MRLFHNRPLALAECVAVLFTVLFYFVGGTPKQVLGIGALLVGLVLIPFVRRERKGILLRLIPTCLLTGCLLLSSFAFYEVRCGAYEARIGETCEVEGTVLRRNAATAYSAQVDVLITRIDGEKVSVKALMETEYASAMQVGDRFVATVTQRDFQRDGDFDEELFRLSDGVCAVFVCASEEQCSILPQADNRPAVKFSKWNTALASRLYHAVGREGGGLAVAVLLGNRSYLSADQTLQFRRAGVSHLLALSGLHVSVLVGALELLLRLLRIPKLARAVTVPGAAVGYLFLTGCSPSAQRAVLMVCVLYLGLLLWASYDSFTALCTVLTVILALTPYAVTDVSMWMSFLAAASIIIFSPLVSRWLRAGSEERGLLYTLRRVCTAVVGAVFVSVVANLGLALLISMVYGEISWGGIPATLLLSPLITGLLILSLLSLLLPQVGVLSFLCGLCADWMCDVARGFSQIRGILLPVGDLPTRICLTVLTAVLILFAVVHIRRALWWALPGGLAVLALTVSLCVTYLPDRGVEAVYLHGNEGSVCLFAEDAVGFAVDFSGGDGADARALHQAAKEARCTEMRDLLLTRYYPSQPYFLSQIATRMRVEHLHLPIPQNEEEQALAHRLEQEASLHGIRVFYGCEGLCARVQVLAFERYESEVLLVVSANGTQMTMTNGAAIGGVLSNKAKSWLSASEVGVIHRKGWSVNGEATLADVLRLPSYLVLETEKMRALLPDPDAIPHLSAGVDKERIFLKKSCFPSVGERLFFIPY